MSPRIGKKAASVVPRRGPTKKRPDQGGAQESPRTVADVGDGPKADRGMLALTGSLEGARSRSSYEGTASAGNGGKRVWSHIIHVNLIYRSCFFGTESAGGASSNSDDSCMCITLSPTFLFDFCRFTFCHRTVNDRRQALLIPFPKLVFDVEGIPSLQNIGMHILRHNRPVRK